MRLSLHFCYPDIKICDVGRDLGIIRVALVSIVDRIAAHSGESALTRVDSSLACDHGSSVESQSTSKHERMATGVGSI